MAGQDFDSVGLPQEFEFSTTQQFLLTVPTDRLYEIFAVALLWTATAGVGNRTIEVRIRGRNSNVLFKRQSKRAQVASEAIRYVWSPGMPDETDVSPDDQLLQPMPLLHIEEAGDILISDPAGIDAADALVGSISVRVYKGE